jgi:hypothetical protein
MEPARTAAYELMQLLDTHKYITYEAKTDQTNNDLSTDFLYGHARGKMFGILVCENKDGEEIILKAFSGQYNGTWVVDGWAPPLFDPLHFAELNTPAEKRIKALGRQMKDPSITPAQHLDLKNKRKTHSQNLMKQIHALYRLHNFKKQQCLLSDLFPGDQGIPTGTGDCCAPKLLNFAAINDLQPISLAEFFWGKTNRSATRHQGEFYPACTNKCGPILGFLLCGLLPGSANNIAIPKRYPDSPGLV